MAVCLVTGGAGFLGSHVVESLIRAGEIVVVLDDLSGGYIENIPREDVAFVQGSITDAELVESLFRQFHFDYIYHLAAYAAEGLSHFIKRFNYQNNLIGSVNLINAAVNYGTKAFVFTSSIAVYGKNQLPMHEDMIPIPEDSYGIAKLAVEQELRISHEMFGLPYIVFRPHNVYGERQNLSDRYRNVVGIFMNQIMQGKALSIFGDGEQTRAFSYVQDVAPIIANAVHNKEALNRVFNVGSDQPYTINYLAEAVCQAFGVEAEIIRLPERNEVKHAYSSHEKIRQFFQLPPATPLVLGLSRMAEWAKLQGVRPTRVFEHVEITKNMPAFWTEG